MVRTQVQLTAEQARSLRQMAAARGVSMAAIIRESVDAYVRSAPRPSTAELRRRALAAIGAFSGPTDLARRHDDYLEEAYAE
jgi:hypothetical protein